MSRTNFDVTEVICPSLTTTFPEIGEAHLFGRPRDWTPCDSTWQSLASFCSSFYVWEVLAPRPSLGAAVDVIAKRETLTEVQTFSCDSINFSVRRGMDAHLVELQPGEAGCYFTADCPCLIAKDMDSGVAFFAHAGRGCLLNEDSFHRGGDYQHKSIVGTIMERFKDSLNVQVRVICGIAAKYFAHPANHPEHGTLNHRRTSWVASFWGMRCLEGDIGDGRLCLKTLIREQFTDPLGFGFYLPEENVRVDDIDTFSDKDAAGDFRWHSCRRDWKGGHQPLNGVLFVNC